MKIIGKTGRDDIAVVYMAEMADGKYVEFVESVQPPIPREEKWVLIVSTLYGCPIGCLICDAGGQYLGKLSKSEILAQIDYLVSCRYPNHKVPVAKFKVQFARMGDPSLNSAVLEVLKDLPARYETPGLMACISTVAPARTDDFFEELLDIKQQYYSGGRFQMQFSIHSTSRKMRDSIIPIKKWDFARIAEYGRNFYRKSDRKIALNFALAESVPINPDVLFDYFDPDIFLIKLTPVNPTISAMRNRIKNLLQDDFRTGIGQLLAGLREKDYEVIVSIGELEENRIGSNCGQYVKSFLQNGSKPEEAYEYDVLDCRKR